MSKQVSVPHYVMNKNGKIKHDVDGSPLVREGFVDKDKLKIIDGLELPVKVK